ncbi:hypothetical protein WISP_95261 [Willisornis vidua]|uniref:Uncharacterized protein n=1 Tax=Willisornis vidua TaxID=1566151 RepID=A0ABQ9D2Z8_9PASS|nr:hypothetical protein WISP_95261 [Willisornis vidua]
MVEKKVDLEFYRVITQRIVIQGSVKDEGWKLITAYSRSKVPPPSQNLTGRTGTFYYRYKALEPETRQLMSKKRKEDGIDPEATLTEATQRRERPIRQLSSYKLPLAEQWMKWMPGLVQHQIQASSLGIELNMLLGVQPTP